MSSPHSQRIVDVTIESIGGLGDGITSVEGKPLFIPKSCVGDLLRVAITQEKEQELRGEICEIISGGPMRVQAPCPHFALCGSCALQQLNTAAYREFKNRVLHGALRQSGYEKTADIVFLPAATRRRAELKLAHTKDGVALAYYELRSHRLVPIHTCLILEPELEALLQPLAHALANLPDASFIRTVNITAADSGIDLLLGCTEWQNAFASPLKKMAEQLPIARLSVQITDSAIRSIIEKFPITMRLGNCDVPLPPDAFLQATREGQHLLTSGIREAVKPYTHIADLFCGVGGYSLPIIKERSIWAADNAPAMIASLQGIIKTHKLNQLQAKERDLFKNPLLANELNLFESVILNPPRAGAKNQVQELAASQLEHVIMVSCNPASWARDAKILRQSGFSLEHIQGIDQFVWSPHIEIMSIFRR